MKTVFIALLAVVSGICAHSQIITTIAGNDTAGNTGDGGPATAAHISPNTVVVDLNKNIYFSQAPVMGGGG
jgi:hypothetical protein